MVSFISSHMTWSKTFQPQNFQIFLRKCHIYLVLGRVWTLKFIGKMFATKRLVLSALIQHDLRLSRLKLLQMFFHKSHIYMVWAECEHSKFVRKIIAIERLVLSALIWHDLRLSTIKLLQISVSDSEVISNGKTKTKATLITIRFFD